MLSTVPLYRVGMNPTERHNSITNWLNSGARSSSDSSSGSAASVATGTSACIAKAVPLSHKHPERVQPEQLRRHRRRSQRSPPEPHIQPPVHQPLELLRHTDLHLVDLQVGVLLLDLVQDQRHRVVAGVDDPHPQTGRRTGGPLRARRRPFDMGENLPRVDQESGTGRAQLHVVGRTLQQDHPQLPFQTLQPLAQRGLDDVLAGRGPPEMQLLGEGDEVAQLLKLHTRHL